MTDMALHRSPRPLRFLPFWRHREQDRAKLARLEQAEAESRGISARAERVTRALDERNRRNHWRESIEQIIQGAP